jgi:membrane carboxypeptidase/penicillin-binding protein PbpC
VISRRVRRATVGVYSQHPCRFHSPRTVKPLAGLDVTPLSRANEPIAKAVAAADGRVTFAAGLLKGRGAAEATAVGAHEAVALAASGGDGRLQWLVDGKPLAGTRWTPEGSGEARVAVVDQAGHSSAVTVRIVRRP